MVYVGDDVQQLVSHVNSKLSLISEWCKFNKLSLNPDKSEFIFISSRKSTNLPVIQIDGNAVKQVKKENKKLSVDIGKLQYETEKIEVKTETEEKQD